MSHQGFLKSLRIPFQAENLLSYMRIPGGLCYLTGCSRLRGKLIQASWSAIRQDAELREFYRSVYQRHPRDRAARKAIVSVARKLTTRIYAVLKEQRPYVVREKVHSAPLTKGETVPQGTTRRLADPRSLC